MTGRRRFAAERGGAYLLALTALLALTGLGIALSGIALIERRLGSADERRQQALNAADSGLALATARLLAGGGSDPLQVVFGAGRTAAMARASRVRVEPPLLVAAAPCASCDPAAGGVDRVSYALAALGEQIVWPGHLSPDDPRPTARASVEAIVTLQPWPIPGSPEPPGAAAGGPACDPEARARALERLRGELHPPGCRFGPASLAVRALDAESGSSCGVTVPVCVLLSGWRER